MHRFLLLLMLIAYAAYAACERAVNAVNQHKTADICRKYIGYLIIEKVNQTLNP